MESLQEQQQGGCTCMCAYMQAFGISTCENLYAFYVYVCKHVRRITCQDTYTTTYIHTIVFKSFNSSDDGLQQLPSN